MAANIDQWPGLHAAHLVGGITTIPDEAPFPPTKDVDVHLIYDEGSPALQTNGAFMNILGVSYGGISIEAGIKPATEHRSASAVLANPAIAHHLTVDSLLYDPHGLLGNLQVEVVRDYSRRQWVLARFDHERQGLAGAFGVAPMVAARLGASGEVNILRYTTTFLAAALWVATLNPPRMGGQMFLRMRDLLAAHGRRDLHEELLSLLGIAQFESEQVEHYLQEATEGFDLAIDLKKAPYPFQHKLHRHRGLILSTRAEACSMEGTTARRWAGSCRSTWRRPT